jgi:hypothetical protein
LRLTLELDTPEKRKLYRQIAGEVMLAHGGYLRESAEYCDVRQQPLGLKPFLDGYVHLAAKGSQLSISTSGCGGLTLEQANEYMKELVLAVTYLDEIERKVKQAIV